ncbi:MAG TPA: GtrA family protein [Gaiellaceae bacterium]|nr:GtrA family protein [Gaiellaceae bacterium]
MSVAVRRAAQPARFLVVGAGGYGVNLLTFAALVAAGVRYVLASVVSYLVSNALMYLGNRYFTFRLGNEGFWPAYARYLLVGLVVVALNAAVLALFVEGLGLDETLAQALSLLVVTPPAYVMFKRWTFRLAS